MQAEQIEPRALIAETARECLRKAKGNTAKAHALFRALVDHQPKLRAELLEPLLDQAIEQAIRGAVTVSREKATYIPLTQDQKREQAASVEVLDGSLLYFILPCSGGKYLKDAMPDELAPSAQYYFSQRRGYGIRGRFLLLVDKAVKDRKRPVGPQFGLEDLRSLYTRATKDEDGAR